jgi:NADH dehydrogenase [ubiquinone] 1 alpha subcomplex assembly factor 7
MTPLAQEILNEIAVEGPITLERYISLCLQHPRYGYYMTRDPFGSAGDFVTAPEISQMFGELLGLWIGEAWVSAGQPANARLVELGPGRGALMADVLRVARIEPQFLDRLEVDLVETSPILREAQRKTLAAVKTPIEWRADFAEVPRGPLFILANEFFDALPVRHFVRASDSWRERLIGADSTGVLSFGLSPYAEQGLTVPAPEGSVIEINAIGQRLMSEIAGRLVTDGGVILIVDYGYTRTTLGESLQAVSRHAFVDPLEAPGEADLTTHVDFAALARVAVAAGAKVLGPTTQGSFLKKLGIERRAQTLSRGATDEQRANIQSAVWRLAGDGPPRECMGQVFKTMAVMHPAMPDLPGFTQ